ncbi:MAG: hydroxyisourate hydrolase [Rhizobiales bacterium]|nr:hydroxyisourate hydrolase [Hyphomicrobiales bacterium]
MGRLTTHVLDTAAGRPAAGLRLEVWAMEPEPRFLKAATTNADGRVETPLLAGEEFLGGVYELRFFVGEYLRIHGLALPDPAFLDVIPIRFGIADAGQHYHVPLLFSPYAYSTYRGS